MTNVMEHVVCAREASSRICVHGDADRADADHVGDGNYQTPAAVSFNVKNCIYKNVEA